MILNATKRRHESGNVRDSSEELELFMQDMDLTDFHSTGCRYTWTNGHTSCKLDRAMVNYFWLQQEEGNYAH